MDVDRDADVDTGIDTDTGMVKVTAQGPRHKSWLLFNFVLFLAEGQLLRRLTGLLLEMSSTNWLS